MVADARVRLGLDPELAGADHQGGGHEIRLAPFEQLIDCEVGTAERGHDRFGGVDPAFADGVVVVPGDRHPVGVGGVGRERRGVWHRQDEMAAGPDDTVDLPEDAVEVSHERERRDRQGDVDVVGGEEGELCRLRLVELDRDLVLGGQGPRGAELGDVVVDRDDTSSAAGESDRGVSLATTQVEDASTGDIAEQSSFDLRPDPRAEVDRVQRAFETGSAGIVQRHGSSLAAARRLGAEGYPPACGERIVKLGLTDAARGNGAGIDYRLAREATLTAWRDGDLSTEQVCDAQRELRRNAEFCGSALSTPCPVCDDDELVEVTYVFGPRLPRHGRCVTSDREMARIDARKSASQGYVVEVCTACGWNHLVRSRSLGG